MPSIELPSRPRIVGRSSSLFTRVACIFALELRVDYAFVVVPNLLSPNAADYAGNPALKLPILESARGPWFGTLNICRELARLSNRELRIVWPETLREPMLANAQELVTQAMASEVTLIMYNLAGTSAVDPHQIKLRTGLLNVMAWLEGNVESLLARMPFDVELSYLEVTLFCLVEHLEFRQILELAPYLALQNFRARFAERPAARDTAYRFDI